jgi:hypothetical protein
MWIFFQIKNETWCAEVRGGGGGGGGRWEMCAEIRVQRGRGEASSGDFRLE